MFVPGKRSVIGFPGNLTAAESEALGVARISYGPLTQRVALRAVQELAADLCDNGVIPSDTSAQLIGGAAAYCSSLTGSSHTTARFSALDSLIARCTIRRLGAAPCQCSSSASNSTRSTARMTSIGPPRR